VPYALDRASLQGDSVYLSLSEWAKSLIDEKLSEVEMLENPRKSGGKYFDNWSYSAGKLLVVCKINDPILTVRVLKIIRFS
jgi:hypothetical protein